MPPLLQARAPVFRRARLRRGAPKILPQEDLAPPALHQWAIARRRRGGEGLVQDEHRVRGHACARILHAPDHDCAAPHPGCQRQNQISVAFGLVKIDAALALPLRLLLVGRLLFPVSSKQTHTPWSRATTGFGVGAPIALPSAPSSKRPPLPRGTMLSGAEWTCAVKINAHCRPERKTIPPQLCKAGGGGAPGTQNRSEALPFRKEGHAWPHFSECAFILTTPVETVDT